MIDLPLGARFRTANVSYEVTADSHVEAEEAEPAKKQKNRHRKFACPRGHKWSVRGSAKLAAIGKEPLCRECWDERQDAVPCVIEEKEKEEQGNA